MLAFWGGCGDFEAEIPESNAPIIHIVENTFSPLEVTAMAGQTIFINNSDSNAHQILSESAAGAFDDTGDIDTGVVLPGYQVAIVIPEDAVSGDVFFYYCGIFTDALTTPDGSIVIE